MSPRGRTVRPPYRPVELWDGRWVFARLHLGMPTFGFGKAPSGLATRRQLRALGMCPGGQDHVAELSWHRGQRWARLYRVDLARPKRIPSPAQLAALDKALAALRAKETCPDCGQHVGYRLDPDNGRTCCYCETDIDSDGAGMAPDSADLQEVA